MKKMLLIGLLSLGIAATQDSPQNYENLGDPMLSDYQLHGPVKEVKSCWKGDCFLVDRFNKFGISLTSFVDRTIEVQSDGSVLINWKKETSGLYKDNFLLILKSKEYGGSNLEFVYRDKVLAQVIGYNGYSKSEGILFVSDYIYENGTLSKIINQDYNKNGEKGLKWIRNYDKEGFLIREENGIIDYTYTHDVDSYGNWVKLYRNGELYSERSINYY